MQNKHIIQVSPEQENQENIQEGIYDFFMEVVKMFVLALVIIVPVRMFLFQPFIVRGISMEPTFAESQYLVVNEFGYKHTSVNLFGKNLLTVEPSKRFNRYDVVVFRAPKNDKDYYIKRVIGLPGEIVEVENGVVTIYNEQHEEGRVLDESAYLPEGRKTNGSIKEILAKDEYYVLGDNRGHSSDSRSFGPRNENEMIGKVLLRAWPLDELDVF